MIYSAPPFPISPPPGPASAALQPQSAGQGLALLLLILAVGVCLIATMVALAALLPQVTGPSKAAMQRSPWRAFFIGLVNYIFLAGITLVIFEAEVDFLNLIGVLILGFVAAVTALGLAGLAQLTGERLARMRTGQMSPLKQLVWGTVVLELTGLLPFVGWFLLAPIMLMVAFGSAVLGWRSRKQPALEELA